MAPYTSAFSSTNPPPQSNPSKSRQRRIRRRLQQAATYGKPSRKVRAQIRQAKTERSLEQNTHIVYATNDPDNDATPPTPSPPPNSLPSHSPFPFLAAPREIRQQILYRTISFADLAQHSVLEIAKAVQELSTVHPCIAADMEYVAELWAKEREESVRLRDLERADVQRLLDSNDEFLRRELGVVGDVAARRRRRREEVPVVVGGGGGGAARMFKRVRRPRKCWKCGERHFGITVRCPRELREKAPWYALNIKK
ncbi:hypothetical protein EJ05DRAFT_475192 [Pseudovirgaria hyperparasitica]|uniref:Uncharacterized protein n=1 Tax=Pseudovirgaria hyperparasitica TaxID=470096 RepID=A0A6A6WAH0_9PEZI|nr:uncharacterized protein EJ05DRAFT_475192 [Pseudovirgaria hyperparasitica]KAF2758950.1 hypothetical protein EJ05DRAFT_475192 [Pseudovirgaria hyperparasitica]